MNQRVFSRPLTALPMECCCCCCWLSCLGTVWFLAGPFCWLLGAACRNWDWAVKTPKFPLGPVGTPYGGIRVTKNIL